MKHTLQICKEKAAEFGGFCLSTEYINKDTKMQWMCSEKHIWWSIFRNVKKNHWCSKCANNFKHTLDDCISFAKKKNGKCLSNNYINIKTKMKWQCSCGNIWFATFGNIIKGTWCPECFGSKKYNIKDCSAFVQKKYNGICLSIKYTNCKEKLIWECSKKHMWEASFDSILRDHWCPICKYSKSENYIRSVFENLTNKSFPSSKPTWLINDKTNYKLELDGFNEELNIAFECQGEQHYKFCKIYHHKNDGIFKYQQYKDNLKIELCEKNDVKLLCIPAIGVKLNGVIHTKEVIDNIILNFLIENNV